MPGGLFLRRAAVSGLLSPGGPGPAEHPAVMHALIVAVVPPFPGKDHVALGVEFRAPAVALAVLPHTGVHQIAPGRQTPCLPRWGGCPSTCPQTGRRRRPGRKPLPPGAGRFPAARQSAGSPPRQRGWPFSRGRRPSTCPRGGRGCRFGRWPPGLPGGFPSSRQYSRAPRSGSSTRPQPSRWSFL